MDGATGQLDERAERAIPARLVIFWLFAILAACTAVALLWFAGVAEATMQDKADATEDPVLRAEREAEIDRTLRTVYTAMAGDLALPVVMWCLLQGVAAREWRRTLWLVGALPAGLAAMAAVLLAVHGAQAAGL